jgi:glycosyltransferase involved in cell wall biosynthesis
VEIVRDGETGFTVPNNDPEVLCDRLQLLISDHTLRAKLGAQAAEYAKGYAWQLIADKITDVYQALVETGRQGDKETG